MTTVTVLSVLRMVNTGILAYEQIAPLVTDALAKGKDVSL